jgi:glycosyltransferase involved in cell wall biosynthesis
VLLVTSIHESGPVLVKEALACGLPVVSVDVGDVADMIQGLDGCLLCPDDRVETIANGLRAALERRGSFDVSVAVARVDQRRLAKRQIEIYGETLHRMRQRT